MTMSEYEQLAREAEARSDWSNFPSVTQLELSQSDGQFILDAIRLLPQLVRELQGAKAKVQAVGKWESSITVDVLVTLQMKKGVRTFKDGSKEVDWHNWNHSIRENGDSQSKVLGWRYLKEQP